MNIIVLMLDSLRPDHLGCYGNYWIKTPNIDRFAEEAIIFERAYAEGLPTLPVRTALFTGRYTLPYRGWQHLEPSDTTLAEILWDRGYRTAMISDTYHMHKPGMGYGRGFDTVIWIRGQEADPYIVDDSIEVNLDEWHEINYTPSESLKGSLYRGVEAFTQYLRNRSWWRSGEDHFIAQVVKTAARWLEEQVDRGFSDRLLLWIDSFDPHEPWDPPEEYYKLYGPLEYDGKPIIFPCKGFVEEYTELELQHVRAQYAGEVTLVDRWVGWFLDRVRDLGLWENSAIFILSDHGEPLGEHGIVRKVQPWPYEELSRIALMIRHPDYPGGRRIDSLVETVDILPTILDFLDIDLRGVSPWSVKPDIQGLSLKPLIEGETESIRSIAISGHYKRSLSVRIREYTLYIWPTPGAEYQWGLGSVEQLMIKSKPELYRTGWSYIPPPPRYYDWRRNLAEREDIFEEEKDTARDLELKLKSKILSLLGYG